MHCHSTGPVESAGEVADDVDIESLGFAHKYDITGGSSDRHGPDMG
jgi:hypothetical protein